MKKDWNAGIDVPSSARRDDKVLVPVMQRARTMTFRQFKCRPFDRFGFITYPAPAPK